MKQGSAQHPSILNNILGPITVGPSSSHLAGPLRLGRLARSIFGRRPQAVEITFSRGSSFAGTYRGHKTDCALVAGLMGWGTDDERIPRAIGEAEAGGIEVTVRIAQLDSDHPNAVKLSLRGPGGRCLEVVGTSEGGGAALLSEIDGRSTAITGEFHCLLLWLSEDCSAAADKLVGSLPGARLIKRDGQLVSIHVNRPLAESECARLLARQEVKRVQQVAPVVSAPGEQACQQPLFGSAARLTELAHSEASDLARLGLKYEMRRQGWTEEKVLHGIGRILKTMRGSLQRGLQKDLELNAGITTRGGKRLLKAVSQGNTVGSGAMARGVAYAMAVNEVSASLGVIAAAPTAGGCGTLPGALFAAAETLGADDEQLSRALLAAGAVGAVFAQQATFLAELCGCQVETGAGSAMAASGIVHLRAGSLQQSLDAASLTLQNILGMECDPVAGMMEVPCITRNGLGAANAILCSDLVMCGIPSVLPLDEVLDAVYDTGRMRPMQCNGTAGLAVTPTSKQIAEEFWSGT